MSKTIKKYGQLFLLFTLLLQTGELFAQVQRFPKPDFESGYEYPEIQRPAPVSVFHEYLDLFILFALLSLATWFVLKKRSRKGIFWISIFSVVWFGFVREGCICSVGSVQNVSEALFNSGVGIPFVVIGFFLLPLIFALFAGRVFCSGVCPLGAIQDLIAFWPQKLPLWIRKTLGIIPAIYLAVAVLFAITNTDYIICRYDPFVGIYRLSGTLPMLFFGISLLIAGMFIARPYCRFICPYGVLLKWVSFLSFKHLTITPSQCISCRLCEDSCPYEAIHYPQPEKKKKPVSRFILAVSLIPVWITIFGFAGFYVHKILANTNTTVRLAQEVRAATLSNTQLESVDLEAFRVSGQSINDLYAKEAKIIAQFKTGSIWAGVFIGLIIGLSIAGLSLNRKDEDYTPDKSNCLSCARCMDYCPVGKDGKLPNIKSKNSK